MDPSPIFYLAITTLTFGIIFGMTELWSVRGAFAEARIEAQKQRGRQ